jgi:hypothetical protein
LQSGGYEMIAVVGLLSLVGIAVGVVSLLFPLRFLGVRSRRMALGVVGGSISTFCIAMAMTASTARGTPEISKPAQQAALVAPQQKNPPIADDGCNLAGAMPNCKEEAAKLAAERAAHPELFDHLDLKYSKRSQASSGDGFLNDLQNNLKAAEASANVRALAAQRDLDSARFASEEASNRLAAAGENLDRAGKKYQMDSDSISYDMRIQQREWERKRRGY